MSLFDSAPITRQSADRSSPLAERMRPERIEDYAGQDHILAPGKPLRRQIEQDRLSSIILWGPPGVGKTTLARIIAATTRSEFIPFSAVLGGIKEIKSVMADAERYRHLGRRTILFIDEIHRFNKAQQDAFLPYVERGDIVLIGATTENPSFEVNAAPAVPVQGIRAAVPFRRANRRLAGSGLAGSRAGLRGSQRDRFRGASALHCSILERGCAVRLQHSRSRRCGYRAELRADQASGGRRRPAQGSALRQIRRRALQHHLRAS